MMLIGSIDVHVDPDTVVEVRTFPLSEHASLEVHNRLGRFPEILFIGSSGTVKGDLAQLHRIFGDTVKQIERLLTP